MPERLRALAGRPLDRRVARAVVALALGVTVGLCLLVGLGLAGSPGAPRPSAAEPLPAPAPSVPLAVPGRPSVPARRASRPRQEPQDCPGTAAHRRAVAQVTTHRALQHVPWRHDGLTIGLVGAEGSRAVLRVAAADLAAARRGYRRFLRRFDDRGGAYLPRFRATGGPR